MSTSDSSGICYVETSDLDGESNLKVRTALEDTKVDSNLKSLSNMKGYIQVNAPNAITDSVFGSFNCLCF